MQSFKELNLSAPLATAIEEMGYTTPTPIQAQTLPLLLEGPTDFLGLAATGTGKTAAFGIPLLESLNNSLRTVQALVLCPTRELALQVTQQLNLLGKHKKLKAVPIYGGAGYGDQIRGLKQGAQIVVATPGRLIDHLERGTVSLDGVQTVVLDEADEMVSMGFKDAIESILESLPSASYNIWLFSATMSKEVRRVADRFLTQPKTVQINKTEMLSGTVKQIYYKVRESDKADILCKIIDASEDFYGLVFCQTKSLVTDLTSLLTSRGYKVDSLHGDKDQNQRERVMTAFRNRRVNLLVCTDVAARGLDVKDLTHVINYSIPRELDSYVHRIGRTGRSGKAGLAMSLVTPSHMGLIGRIEDMTKSRIELGVIPTRREIGMKKVNKLLERFQSVEQHQRVEELLGPEWLSAIEGMTKNEIAARLLTLTFQDLFVDKEKSTLAQMPGNPRGQEGQERDSSGGGRRDRGHGRGDRDRGRDRNRGGRGGERREFRGDLERFDNKREPRGASAGRVEGRGYGAKSREPLADRPPHGARFGEERGPRRDSRVGATGERERPPYGRRYAEERGNRPRNSEFGGRAPKPRWRDEKPVIGGDRRPSRH